ncbi:hypothetical protein E6H18_11025 [Candidatus Bathyarchaeota archaeon]|nr:MAG: hypothetical protein E6H18_11025 [Candidatus Bathyarchaeota archaeon]
MNIMEFGRQYEVWPCPFCTQDMISVIHFPKSVSVKTSRTASLPGGKGFHANPDVYLISSDCAKRGKTQQELEKRLKEEGMI